MQLTSAKRTAPIINNAPVPRCGEEVLSQSLAADAHFVRPRSIAGATIMFDKLLPQRLDNAYRGHKVALWLFGLVVVVKSAQSLAIIFDGYSTARDADGIPLDGYPSATAQTVVSVLAQGSLWRLTFCLGGMVVLLRYRSAVPLMFALLVVNYLAGQVMFHFVPLVRLGTPPGPIVNLILFFLMIIGLALSIWRGTREAQR
jgi:hypothetical protein